MTSDFVRKLFLTDSYSASLETLLYQILATYLKLLRTQKLFGNLILDNKNEAIILKFLSNCISLKVNRYVCKKNDF